MWSIVDLFVKKGKEDAEPKAPPIPPATKPAERSFLQEIRDSDAWSASRDIQYEDDPLLGPNSQLSAQDKIKIAKAIVQSVPRATIRTATVDENGLEVVEDESPGSDMFGPTGNDGRFDNLQGVYAAINPRILRHFASRAFIGYPACELLGTHEIINPCCSLPGEDAMASGYKLKCVSEIHSQGDEHIIDEDQWLTGMKRISDRMGMNKVCTDLSFYTRLYGIGLAVPRVELKDGHTMEEPYDPKFVKPGSYRGFTVVDPQDFMWDYDDAESLFNPLSEWYMRPEYLRFVCGGGACDGMRIHRSWCVVNIFREVGTRIRATYMWGGVPLSQQLYERMFCADKLANEIVNLAMSKRTVVKEGDIEQLILNPKKTGHFINRFNYFRSNNNVCFCQPGENVQQLETSLADLQPLSAQQYQYAAAIAGIPVTKLLKNVPSGLQATGQYEQDEYEQTLNDIREQCFMPLLSMHYELFIRSNYPDREDLAVEVLFNPLQSPKAPEVLQMASQRASMVCSLVQQNIITATEGRAILKDGDSPVFSSVASETPEIVLKIEKMRDPEEQQKMQMMGGAGGGMAGMPGAAGGAAGAAANLEAEQKAETMKNVFQDALAKIDGENGGEGEGQPATTAGEGAVPQDDAAGH